MSEVTPNDDNNGKQYKDGIKDAVVRLRSQNLSFGKIAKLLQMPRSSVSTIFKKFQLRGSTAVTPRKGRPSKTTQRDDNRLIYLLKTNRHGSIKELYDEFNKLREKRISMTTFRTKIKNYTNRFCVRY